MKKAHVRLAALDQEVERRTPRRRRTAAPKGKALDLPEPEPWPEPVDGAELIAGLVEQIARYVILSEHAALAVALWILHAHALDSAFHSPRLTPYLADDALRQEHPLAHGQSAGPASPAGRQHHTIGDVPCDRGGQADPADR